MQIVTNKCKPQILQNHLTYSRAFVNIYQQAKVSFHHYGAGGMVVTDCHSYMEHCVSETFVPDFFIVGATRPSVLMDEIIRRIAFERATNQRTNQRS